MRLLLVAMCTGLAACAPEPPLAQCDVSVAQDVTLSGSDARETIVASAIGPSCDKAVGLYAVYAADGHPAWAWAAPLSRAYGDAFTHADEADMREFLLQWAQADVTTTQTAPAWTALAPGQTTLDRLTYDDIRARNLPMLCHSTGTGRELCVFWEPAAGGAGLYFERDTEETDE